ncbi:MAG: chemotaxis protein CheW [Reinekea sp.]
MGSSDASKTKLMPTTSKLAVMSYLDDLLHEATMAAEVEVAPQVVSTTEVEAVEQAPTVAVDLTAVPVESVVETEMAEVEPEPVPVEPVVEAEPEVEPVIEIEPQDEQAPPVWMENGRPAWAQQRFECLVFCVNGLKLAVPLLLLGNIHPLDKELTPLFDQPSWFLGLLPVQQERNIRVVDTAQLVMPERSDRQSVDQLKYAVGVHNSDWAFGAHTIEGSVSLEPDAVKWRSQRTSRPWLAGTVISEMCALVDLDAFNRILVDC